MGDAEIIPIGTKGRPGRGSAAGGAKPSSASRDLAGPRKSAAKKTVPRKPDDAEPVQVEETLAPAGCSTRP